jgi:5-methylcytosine-specific restriction endonuclease McrBC regulatory subunit McrC
VRGRLLYGPAEVVTALRNPGVMTYSVDELSGDNAANALLVRAGNELAAASQDAVVRIAVREAIAPVEALLERGRHTAFTGRLPAQYDAYRVPLEIAAMLQRRNVARPGDAPALGHGLVLDTHRIFEAFVERSVEIAVEPLGLTARHQVDVVYGQARDGGAPLRTRPDVLVFDAAGDVLLVVDAKYKVPPREDRLRGTASDNYQLLASMLAHKATNGVLLYPSRNPPQVHRWTVDVFGRTHQLAIATIDPGSFTGAPERDAFDTRLAGLLQYLSNARAAA